MREHHLKVTRTARYYTANSEQSSPKHMVFLIHGFAQLAESFLQSFTPEKQPDVLWVAPEALNRFYAKGSGGEVGATWMTKADRLHEIEDYIGYLNQLYFTITDEYPNCKSIHALGFSQGASTVTRWVNAGVCRFNKLLVYAGEVAPELLPLQPDSGLRITENHFICGTADKYFPPAIIEKMKEHYASLQFTYHRFEGGHDIVPSVVFPLITD